MNPRLLTIIRTVLIVVLTICWLHITSLSVAAGNLSCDEFGRPHYWIDFIEVANQHVEVIVNSESHGILRTDSDGKLDIIIGEPNQEYSVEIIFQGSKMKVGNIKCPVSKASDRPCDPGALPINVKQELHMLAWRHVTGEGIPDLIQLSGSEFVYEGTFVSLVNASVPTDGSNPIVEWELIERGPCKETDFGPECESVVVRKGTAQIINGENLNLYVFGGSVSTEDDDPCDDLSQLSELSESLPKPESEGDQGQIMKNLKDALENIARSHETGEAIDSNVQLDGATGSISEGIFVSIVGAYDSSDGSSPIIEWEMIEKGPCQETDLSTECETTVLSRGTVQSKGSDVSVNWFGH